MMFGGVNEQLFPDGRSSQSRKKPTYLRAYETRAVTRFCFRDRVNVF